MGFRATCDSRNPFIICRFLLSRSISARNSKRPPRKELGWPTQPFASADRRRVFRRDPGADAREEGTKLSSLYAKEMQEEINSGGGRSVRDRQIWVLDDDNPSDQAFKLVSVFAYLLFS